MDYDGSIEYFSMCRKLQCICCGESCYDFECTLIPYGSDYDQEALCNSCLVRIADPYIKEQQEKRRFVR